MTTTSQIENKSFAHQNEKQDAKTPKVYCYYYDRVSGLGGPPE